MSHLHMCKLFSFISNPLSYAQGLVLKQRQKEARNWPIKITTRSSLTLHFVFNDDPNIKNNNVHKETHLPLSPGVVKPS